MVSEVIIGLQFWLVVTSQIIISLFINVENVTDRRQTKWDTLYTGSIINPVFRDIYAPLDGVVVNTGVKIKL